MRLLHWAIRNANNSIIKALNKEARYRYIIDAATISTSIQALQQYNLKIDFSLSQKVVWLLWDAMVKTSMIHTIVFISFKKTDYYGSS